MTLRVLVERFELEELVYEGSATTVHRGSDRSTTRPVAVKMLRGKDEATDTRFQNEVELLQAIQGRAIVKYVAHDATPNAAFLATEWLEGPTLAERLQQGPVGAADALVIGRRIADALATVHRASASHRDVKPSNIILVDGASTNATLIDFGIARHGSRGLSSHATFQGGTWAYMSPEQMMGAAELGPSADVFALGCVLYESISGKRPYPAERSAAMIAKVWRDPPRLRAAAPDVSRTLDDFVAQLLAKEPRNRPRDGAEVFALLSALRP